MESNESQIRTTMDRLRVLKAFVHCVELGSLSGAARAMHITQASLDKMLRALEQALGTPLLHRGSARLSLTEEGRQLHARARRLLEHYDDAVAELHAHTQPLRGVLRLSAARAMGELRTNAMALAFLQQHPELELEMLLEDRFVDLVEERIDVALRLDGPLPPDLVARPAGRWPRWLVASPDYIERRGLPRNPQELSAHDYIRGANAAGDGLVLHDERDGRSIALPLRSRYRVSSDVAMLDCVRQGAGIALQPAWAVGHLVGANELVHVLPHHAGPVQQAHLLCAPQRQQPLRVHLLIEFLAGQLALLPGSMPPPPPGAREA